MIRVNLLPVEKRRPEKTPLPRFLIVVGGTVASALLIAWTLFLMAAIRTTTEEKEAALRDRETQLAKVAEFDQKTEILKQAEKWGKTIAAVEGLRPLKWSWVIDKTWDTLWKCPKVWWTSLKAEEGAAGSRPPQPGKPFVVYSYAMECLANGDAQQMNDFRLKIQNDPDLFNDKLFNGINTPPEYAEVSMPDFKEKKAIKFKVVISRLETPQKKAPAAQPGGAPGQPPPQTPQ